MTTRFSLIILPLALLVGACDDEDTAQPDVSARVESEDGPRHDRHGKLAKLDTDQDGAISRAEAEGTRLAEKFADLDADKDGKLGKDELGAMKGHHGRKDPAERAARMLEKFDADKDGSLTAAELGDHHLAAKFAEFDADKDGKLDKDELIAAKSRGGKGDKGWHGKDPEARAAKMLEKFDADKDGSLTAAEVKDHGFFAEKFAEIDSNKDGKLGKDELVAAKGRGGKGGKGWHDKDPAERAAKMLEKFDADKDGSLTAAEVQDRRFLAEKFAEIDSNKDGKLSKDELGAWEPPHHGGKRARG